jgi:hypothetical protein
MLPCRMNGNAMMHLKDAQLLAQCHRVLAAEEASALQQITALATSQLPTEQLATQRTSPSAQQAAPQAGSPQKPQFSLPPPHDPDATIPVELSEETRQRRAALMLERKAAEAHIHSAAILRAAPSQAITTQGGAVQQRSSAATQQQQPTARKPKPSLCDCHCISISFGICFQSIWRPHPVVHMTHFLLCSSLWRCCYRMESLLGPASPPQEPQQPVAAQPSQSDTVAELPAVQPRAAVVITAAEASAGDALADVTSEACA